MTLIDGKATAAAIKEQIAQEVAQIVAQGGKQPHLVAVLVGHDGGSETYVKNKVLACEKCGFKSTLIRYEDDVTEEELLACVDRLNKDEDVDGFIVQLPLPKHIDEQKASLPRKMGRIGGYPVGVFIAERSREQGFVARCFHALADLVLKNGHALRISPFIVRQNMQIDGAVTINGRGQSADTLKIWHVHFRCVPNVIGFTRGTGKEILPRAPGIAVPIDAD